MIWKTEGCSYNKKKFYYIKMLLSFILIGSETLIEKSSSLKEND